jgi:hypothetical protein
MEWGKMRQIALEPMEGDLKKFGSNWKRQIAFMEVGKTHQLGIGTAISPLMKMHQLL